MLAVHIVGAIVAAIGLVLFAAEQWTAGERGKDGSAGLKAWKVELGGPPALILIVIGLMVFLFPFWSGRDQPVPTTSTTTTTLSTTTTTPSTTTFPTILVDPTSLSFLPEPAEPTWWAIEFDPVFCESEAIYWEEDSWTDYWIVDVAALIGEDVREIEFQIDTFEPFICDWEFLIEGYDRYWIWITGWNDVGPGPFLWLEYPSP